MAEPLPESIAGLALHRFQKLPRKCWPQPLPDGRSEWTPLSAIVARHGDDLACIALATGTKCLPRSLLPQCHGTVVHDCHAEILALRALNRWLLDEALLLAQGSNSPYLVQSSSSPLLFQVKEQVSFHIFTTEAPCGDASMELLMASKGKDGSVPWTPKAPSQTLHDSSDGVQALPGRAYFSELGIVRRKPGRGDAEPSWSKSCSDKLTMKQYLGLLSFPADLLIERTDSTFLKSIVLPADQANEPGYSRAFGRGPNSGHTVKIDILPPSFQPSFQYARSQSTTNSNKVSNVSVVWIGEHGAGAGAGAGATTSAITEVLINGVRQGFKQFDSRPAKESAVCRKQMWRLARQVLDSFGDGGPPPSHDLAGVEAALASRTYAEAKASHFRANRSLMKQTVVKQLGSWPPNEGDGSWGLG